MFSFLFVLFQILIQQRAMLPHTNLRVKVEIQCFRIVEDRSADGNISTRSIVVHSQYVDFFSLDIKLFEEFHLEFSCAGQLLD